MKRLDEMDLKKATMLGGIIFGSVGCDQASKYTAKYYLEGTGTHSYLGDTFRLLYIENHGAFLGLGSNLPEFARTLIFTVFVAIMLVAVGVWVFRDEDATPTALVAAALVVGGGVGNLIDRVVNNGGVIDFLNIGIGPVRTGIFNIADVWIMAGAVLLVFAGIGEDKDEDEAAADSTVAESG